MTREDKQLLLEDLCGRLPYGVKCRFTDTFDGCEVDNVLHPDDITDMFRHRSHCDSRIDVKPYLRPMSSMTEEEKKEYHDLCYVGYGTNDLFYDSFKSIKGRALSTEDFNPYEEIIKIIKILIHESLVNTRENQIG